MTTNFARIKQFHARFDPTGASESLDNLLTRRVAYLAEEVRETNEAAEALRQAPTDATAKAHLVKELVDVLHVTYGFLHLLGVDADAAFTEVHRSNMSKTPNPQGKAIKGPEYTPADMAQFIQNENTKHETREHE